VEEMNVENFKKVRAAIAAAPDHQFNMTTVFSPRDGNNLSEAFHCGSAACIIGWAGYLANPSEMAYITERGFRFLDLQSHDEEAHIFGGEFMKPAVLLDTITKEMALAYLDKAIQEENVFVTVHT
jgi:hypothetical protein